MVRPILLLSAMLASCTGDEPSGDDAPHPTDGPVTDSAVPTDTDTDVPSDVVVQLSGPIPCADPTRRDEARFDRVPRQGGWEEEAYDPASTSLFVGGGLAVADFDGDGLLDMVLTSYDALQYFAGAPGPTFVNRTDTLPTLIERSTGATPVDYDGDGDMDVFVAVFKGPDALLLNDGHGVFSEVAYVAGVMGRSDGRSMSSSWGDYDGDGDLDGFVASYGQLGTDPLPPGDPSYLYENLGDGTFADRSSVLPQEIQLGHSFVGSWIDLDHDRWPELYVVNDFGWKHPNPVLDNQAGSLVLDTSPLGLDAAMESMGLAVGDLNGDDVPDFLVAAWSAFRLFISSPSGWYDYSQTLGVRPEPNAGRHVAWGAEFADLDNDGDLDLFIAYGHLGVSKENPKRQPDAVFLQQEDGSFEQVAEAWGVADDGRSRGFVVTDLDGDGWLDILKRDLRGPTLVDVARCGSASWLEVVLKQPGANRNAIGARVRVLTEDHHWTRWIQAGGTSYGSGGPPVAHFGLGAREDAITVEVAWPDGTDTTLTGVDVRQIVTIERRD